MKPFRPLATALALPAGLLALGGCGGDDTPSRLRQAQAAIAPTLPAPYFEDLVTEAVEIDGDRLVLRVRSPVGDAEKTRLAPGFESLRASEQGELRRLCALPAIRPLAGTGAVLARRFVDRHGKLFFEVELPARECPSPPA